MNFLKTPITVYLFNKHVSRLIYIHMKCVFQSSQWGLYPRKSTDCDRQHLPQPVWSSVDWHSRGQNYFRLSDIAKIKGSWYHAYIHYNCLSLMTAFLTYNIHVKIRCFMMVIVFHIRVFNVHVYITQCKLPLQVTEYKCTLHTIDVYITHCLTSVEVTVYNVLSCL